MLPVGSLGPRLLRMCKVISVLIAWSVGPGLLKMYKARRRACRMRLLQTLGPFGKERSSDKEAESKFPSATYDTDLKHTSPCCR